MTTLTPKSTLKENLYTRLINDFYDKKEHFDMIYNIIKRRKESHGLSLRLIDYLCTSYRQTKPIKTASGDVLYMDEIYHNNLRELGKSNFDCFKRHKRLTFTKHGLSITTTIAQLMFFKTMISYGVISFALQNLTDIKTQMSTDFNNAKIMPKRCFLRRKKRSAKSVFPHAASNVMIKFRN